MVWQRLVRAGLSVALALTAALALTVTAGAAGHGPPTGWAARPPLHIKLLRRTPDKRPVYTSSGPTGLSPSAIYSVYGLTPGPSGGSGQIIAIVDAYHDPNALSDLNTFSAEYGLPTPTTSCSSVGPNQFCFQQVYAQGFKPKVNSGWVLEESLDIEWAHAQAPKATIILVEAASNSFSNLFGAIKKANSLGATQVSLSWGGNEFSGETSYDSYFQSGIFYTVSAGDSGNGAEYPAASPRVIAVGGTTLNGCGGTSCSGFSSETAWSGSGGGISAYESIPAFQSDYLGPVYGAASITALTSAFRGIPDVSFDADPNTGVSVYDSTSYVGQSGWWTLGGTSVGAPNWAGILASGAAAKKTALQGDGAIYGGGYKTNLRDITSGSNGSCGTDCTAGTGYDLVTGLGSPINYP